MTKNHIYILTSIILFCGFFLIWPTFSDTWTEGIPKFLLNLGLWIIICGLTLLYTINWYNKTDRPKYSFLPLTALVLILLTNSFGKWFKELKYNGPNKITASSTDIPKFGRALLKLQDNNYYLLELDQIEWTSLFYLGTYKLSNDTIVFSQNLKTLTDEVINNSYILTKDNKYLIPLIKEQALTDSSAWLTVEH